MRLESPVVLVVDDDELVRDLLRIRLELDGMMPVMARDGVEAMTLLSSHRPAAMLLDVSMPRMDGFQVLETLRKSRLTPPPTLMLTARNAVDDVRRAIELGAKDYLAKPFNDQLLLRRVRRLLRSPTRMVSALPVPDPGSDPSSDPSSDKELFL